MFQNFEIIKISEFQKIISERTILYNLEPIGIGTPYVESLSSYLVRLATVHQVSVSVLLNKVIEPYLNSSFVKKELKDGITKDTSGFINENNFVTLDFVNALEVLTGRTDLRSLTILNWTGLINDRSIGDFRKWCPCCLEEMRNNSNIVYEPLLWYMKLVEFCDIHNVLLKNTCWHCNKKLKFLGSKISMGYCQHCHSWLGQFESEDKTKINELGAFYSSCMKEMMANTSSFRYYPTHTFISYYLNEVYRKVGFASKQQMAIILGFNDSSVHTWMNRSNKTGKLSRPNNISLFKLIRNCNTSFIGLLKNEININLVNKLLQKELLDNKEIEKILLEKKYSNKSLNTISKEIGVDVSILKSRFPDCCKEIRQNYSRYKQSEIKNRKKKVKSILEENLKSDTPKSVKSLFKENDIPYVSGRRAEPELIKKVSARYKAFLNEKKRQRIEMVISEMEIIMEDLHNRGIRPTIYQIGLVISSNPHDIRKPEIFKRYTEILKSYGYKVD